MSKVPNLVDKALEYARDRTMFVLNMLGASGLVLVWCVSGER